MTFEEFKIELDAKMAAMTNEELMEKLRKAGFRLEGDECYEEACKWLDEEEELKL